MQFKKIIFSVLFGVFLPVTLLSAADITVSDDVMINLSGLSRILHILNTSNALNEFTVDNVGNSLSVVLAAGSGSVTIKSTEGLNLGGTNNDANIALSSCNSEGSTLIIPALSSSTRTVLIAPNNTICYSASGGGGGSGGGSGVSTATSIQQVGTSTVSEEKKEEEKKESEKTQEEIMFVDIGKLKSDAQQNILQIATLMVSKNTYDMPKSKKFQPNSSTTGEFALQAALAISGDGCGGTEGYPGASKCKKQAISEKIVNSKFKLNTKASRVQYYAVLLKAIGAKLESSSTKNLKAVCKDAKNANKQIARVFMTAKNVGIASVYKGNKCGLKSAFPRWQAALFAIRALNAK